jgi:hypothetical protein
VSAEIANRTVWPGCTADFRGYPPCQRWVRDATDYSPHEPPAIPASSETVRKVEPLLRSPGVHAWVWGAVGFLLARFTGLVWPLGVPIDLNWALSLLKPPKAP